MGRKLRTGVHTGKAWHEQGKQIVEKKPPMNGIVAARCALKELASYLHANGRQLRSSFPNPPVYNDNPRNTSFRGMMDNDQIAITHPTNFCHGS